MNPVSAVDRGPFSLGGRTALVTGASRGIGAAAARALDRAGARVALVARSRADLEEVAGGLTHDPVVIVGDLRDAASPDRCRHPSARRAGPGRHPGEQRGDGGPVGYRRLRRRGHRRDAGREHPCPTAVDRHRHPLDDPTPVGVDHQSVVGLRAWWARRAGPPTPRPKGGLDAATRSMAIELGPSGIRVNSVAPWRRRHGAVGQEQGDPGRHRADRGADPAGPVGRPRGRRRCDRVPGLGRGPVRDR